MGKLGRFIENSKIKLLVLVMALVMCLCIGFVNMFVPKIVRAEDLATCDLVTMKTEGIVPRISTDKETDKVDEGGILIVSEGAYEGAFNGVFKGNTSILFEFPASEGLTWDGQFVFRISDVLDENNYFLVKYYMAEWWGTGAFSAAAVGYDINKNGVVEENEYRTSQYDNPDVYFDSMPSGQKALVVPGFSGYNGQGSALFTLDWSNDILGVQVQNYGYGTMRYIAKFDGTKDFVSGVSWGFPSLSSFKNGYRISFESLTGADVCFNNIQTQEETVDLKQESLSVVPKFYERFRETVHISLSDVPAFIWNSQMGDYFIPKASYTTGTDINLKPVEKIEIYKQEKLFKTVTSDYVWLASGDYELRYTAISSSGEDRVGNVVKYNIKVGDYWYRTDKLISGDDIVSTFSKTTDGAYPKTGLTVEGQSGYTADINGTFKGNTKLEFAFLSKALSGQDDPAAMGFGDFQFRIADAKDPSIYFEIIYHNTAWAGWYMEAYVQYGEEIRTSGSGKIFNTTNNSVEGETSGEASLTYGGFRGADLANGTISLWIEWTGDNQDILAVKARTKDGLNTYSIAEFDGTDIISDEKQDFGLPKLTSMKENGYRISFGSFEYGTPICFTSINDVSISNAVVDDMAIYESYALENASDEIEVPATADPLKITDIDQGAKISYKIKLGNFQSDLIYDYIYSDLYFLDIDFSEIAEYNLQYNFLGESAQRVLKVYDAPPIVKLNNGISENSVYLTGRGAWEINIDDITATDRLDGKLDLTERNVVIKIYAPGDETGIVLEGNIYEPTQLGKYRIEYTVTHQQDDPVSINRYIEVIDGNVPVITLGGEIPETAALETSFTLPVATAKDGNVEMNGIQVEVFCEYKNEKTSVAIHDGVIVFAKPGIYTISYYIADSDGNECLLNYEVKVAEDKTPPIIFVDQMPTTGEVGKEIVFPSITAIDDISGDVEPQITVMLGVETIQIEDGGFIPDQEGVYSVRVVAEDHFGNSVEEIYYINVYAAGGGHGGSGNLPLILGLSITGAIIVICGAVIAIVVLRKKRK